MGTHRVDGAKSPEAPPLDPIASARQARLRYVDDTGPGFRRARCGKGFRYLEVDGAPLTDPAQIERIRHLAIPPAWTKVWICPLANGHIQATGRDARGRKQYRYHARWREVRDETKYGRLAAFAEALPRIRAAVLAEIEAPGLTREKVLGAVVRLLDVTFIRVGHEEYVRQNGSFGLTTMRDRHVDVEGSVIHFRFRGKSGVERAVDIRDRRLARVVQRCHDLPGEILFQYVDLEGRPHPIEATDVNEHIRALAGADFSAKDFRTWAGTLLAAEALRGLPVSESAAASKRNLVSAIKDVARRLGNTPAVCRRCYVHPGVMEAYLRGELARAEGARASSKPPPPHALTAEEEAVMELLRGEPAVRRAA